MGKKRQLPTGPPPSSASSPFETRRNLGTMTPMVSEEARQRALQRQYAAEHPQPQMPTYNMHPAAQKNISRYAAKVVYPPPPPPGPMTSGSWYDPQRRPGVIVDPMPTKNAPGWAYRPPPPPSVQPMAPSTHKGDYSQWNQMAEGRQSYFNMPSNKVHDARRSLEGNMGDSRTPMSVQKRR